MRDFGSEPGDFGAQFVDLGAPPVGRLWGRCRGRRRVVVIHSGRVVVGGGDPQAGPALLLLARPAPYVRGERIFARGEELEIVLHAAQPVEGRHALCPGAQLTSGLRPAKQEHRHDRALPVVETQCLIEHVAVADDRSAVGGQHEADKLRVLQLVEGGVNRGLVVAHDGLPVRGLVARGHEGVEGERVLLRRRQRLLYQRAEHPRAGRAQTHGTEHTVRPVFVLETTVRRR